MAQVELITWQKKQTDLSSSEILDNHAEDVHKVLPHTAVLIQAAAELIRSCERVTDKLPLSVRKKLEKLVRLNEERINLLLVGGRPFLTTGTPQGLISEPSKAERRKERRKLRRRMK